MMFSGLAIAIVPFETRTGHRRKPASGPEKV
jgi:hypothetical protein